jgi:hypothetical protein
VSLRKNENGLGWVVDCDCGEVMEILDALDKTSAAYKLMSDGWRFVKVGKIIKHMCPQCLEAANNDKNSEKKCRR